MLEGDGERTLPDPEFRRAMCLETIKDIRAEIRHAEVISATISALSLAAAGSVFSFLWSIHEPSAAARAFTLDLSIALIFLGGLLIMINSVLFHKANLAARKGQNIILYLTERADLPCDLPDMILYEPTKFMDMIRGGSRRETRLFQLRRETHLFQLFIICGMLLFIWGVGGVAGLVNVFVNR